MLRRSSYYNKEGFYTRLAKCNHFLDNNYSVDKCLYRNKLQTINWKAIPVQNISNYIVERTFDILSNDLLRNLVRRIAEYTSDNLIIDITVTVR